MNPPPGSDAGLGGDPRALGVRVAGWRSTMLWVGTALMVPTVLALAGLQVLVLRDPAGPGRVLLPLLVVLMVWMILLTALLARSAIIHRGPMLVVDDEGVRSRDVFGWLRVPWAAVTAIDWEPRRGQLVVTAPGRISLNQRRLRRRALRIAGGPLLSEGEQLLSYLRHRWAVAGGRTPSGPAVGR